MAYVAPPQHRIDAPIVWIHRDDSAWDADRIEADLEKMRAENLDPADHPVLRYHGGWTRYDIDARATLFGETVSARDYLDESKAPTRWHLRRLTSAEWYDVAPLWERAARTGERPIAAYYKCATIGVRKVEAGPALELTGGVMTPRDREAVHAIGTSFMFELGSAVYAASMELREDERRPLG